MQDRESQPTVTVEAWEKQTGMPSVNTVIRRVRVLSKEARERRKNIVFRKLIDQAMGELGVPKEHREDMRRMVGEKMGKIGGEMTAESRKVFRAINDELNENRERTDQRQLQEELERGGYESADEMHDDINK